MVPKISAFEPELLVEFSAALGTMGADTSSRVPHRSGANVVVWCISDEKDVANHTLTVFPAGTLRTLSLTKTASQRS